jgi:hypothetical protein
VVTACSPCNTRKGSRMPEEIGMHPLVHPVEPHFVHLSWAVRRLTPTQSKYIRLFYGEETLHQLEMIEHRSRQVPGAVARGPGSDSKSEPHEHQHHKHDHHRHDHHKHNHHK